MTWPPLLPTTSDPAEDRRRRATVYLDANVLTAGLVRTLVLLSGPIADHRTIWSPYAEREAARHQPSGAKGIATVRRQYGLRIVPDGQSPVPLVDTDPKDIPILASAAAADAAISSPRTSKTSVHEVQG